MEKIIKLIKKNIAFVIILPIILISLLGNVYFIFSRFKAKNRTYSAVVSQVKDGDTLVTGDGETLRLINIDAPEYPDGCLATQAKTRLEELVNGKKIKLEAIEDDNFGRILAWVWQDEVLINKILVQEGLAQVTKHEYQYTAELIKVESEAKKLAKGIWSDQCQPDSNCVIKANYRPADGTKVYHLPDCYNYDKIVIDQSNGDGWFCTEAEAQQAGFRKSQDCP